MKLAFFVLTSFICIIFIGCGGDSWTADQIDSALKDCPKQERVACECGIQIISNEFTYNEYTRIRGVDFFSKNQSDEDKALLERVYDIEEVLESSCGS
tara:strand:- start:7 stop:300 length:294 start_codon:yes stop_codon:yes gene_type:complete